MLFVFFVCFCSSIFGFNMFFLFKFAFGCLFQNMSLMFRLFMCNLSCFLIVFFFCVFALVVCNCLLMWMFGRSMFWVI